MLTEVIDSDVKEMQKLSPTDVTISLNKLTDTKLLIARIHNDRGFIKASKVVFELLGYGIEARSERGDTLLFLAKASLTPSGKCKLFIDGEPLEFWQVSKRGLDDLFFPA